VFGGSIIIPFGLEISQNSSAEYFITKATTPLGSKGVPIRKFLIPLTPAPDAVLGVTLIKVCAEQRWGGRLGWYYAGRPEVGTDDRIASRSVTLGVGVRENVGRRRRGPDKS
jgi:hypothetical protein